MNLNTIYKDFCTHTSLSDQVYENVFKKIWGVLGSINQIKWLYLTHKNKIDNTTETFNFSTSETIPVYVLDLIKNAFGDYYTLPRSVVVIIALQYNNVEYQIVSTSYGTEIPEEIKFIKEYDLFNFFCIINPVADLFSEFDVVFDFTKNFKPSLDGIFPALEKKFKLKDIHKEASEGGLTNKEIATTEFTIEELQKRIKDILSEIERIRRERDILSSNLNNINVGVSSRSSLLDEKQKLTIEYRNLKDSIRNYENRKLEFINILGSIDSEIRFSLDRPQNTKYDIEYLKSKKKIFEGEKTSMDQSILDTSKFLHGLSLKLDSISSELNKIEGYDVADINNITISLRTFNQEQDKLCSILVSLENELKVKQKTLMDKNINSEKYKTYTDLTISNVENNSIVSHLSSAVQPTSITTVVNYLRYYFCYHATLFADGMLTKYPDINTYVIQALASKLVLAKQFGIKFKNIFSTIQFNDDDVERVILVVKE